MRFSPLAAALSIAAGIAAPASAAIINLNFNLTASGFTPAVAPYDPIVGIFALTFDNSADVLPTSTGLMVSGFSFPAGSAPKFAYQSGSDFVSIGTNPGVGSFTLFGNQFDFGFFIGSASTNPTAFSFSYSAANLTFYNAGTVTLGAVPEPATWVMLIGGFGMVGAAVRRRRTALAA